MTRRSNNKPLYRDRLAPGDPDVVALALAVEERFLQLCANWLRSRGEQLPVPRELDGDLLRWRTMRARHGTGDLRSTPAELASTKALAEWTVLMNCELRNQSAKKIQWKE